MVPFCLIIRTIFCRTLTTFNLSLIGSTQSFLVLLFSGIVGRLLDAGFHRSIAITGSSLLTIGTLTLSWTSGSGRQGEGNYGLIWLTSAFIAGLGEACFFVFSSQNAAAWFPRSKSPAVGFTSSGAALGEGSQLSLTIASLTGCKAALYTL